MLESNGFRLFWHSQPRRTGNLRVVDSCDETLSLLKAFSDERDWEQFHTPSNLAKSISIEAAELLECYQWGDDANLDDVTGELADVLTYCLFMAQRLGLDPVQIVRNKLEITRSKYPIDKFKGSSEKYDGSHS